MRFQRPRGSLTSRQTASSRVVVGKGYRGLLLVYQSVLARSSSFCSKCWNYKHQKFKHTLPLWIWTSTPTVHKCFCFLDTSIRLCCLFRSNLQSAIYGVPIWQRLWRLILRVNFYSFFVVLLVRVAEAKASRLPSACINCCFPPRNLFTPRTVWGVSWF